jgi:hypothetical protein
MDNVSWTTEVAQWGLLTATVIHPTGVRRIPALSTLAVNAQRMTAMAILSEPARRMAP